MPGTGSRSARAPRTLRIWRRRHSGTNGSRRPAGACTPCTCSPMGGSMNLVTHKKFKGDRLMPWGKATIVTGAKGYVFLPGNTATAEDYDPLKQRGGAVGDPAAQWRAILANIKSDLEDVGSALEHLVKLTFYVKGPFPNGGVLSSPNFRLDVLDEFFEEHCPKHCSYNNPPPSEVIGISALAHPDLVIEIVAIAALPD